MRHTLLFLFICSALLLNAQNSDFTIKRYHHKTGYPVSISFSNLNNTPQTENTGEWFIRNLNANPSFSLKFKSSLLGIDKLNHIRYNQYFGRFRVESAEIILHQKNNKTVSMTGVFYPALVTDTAINISSSTAISNAKALFPNAVFMWEVKAEEEFLKKIKKDPAATYLPKPELVIFSNELSGKNSSFKLAYKIDIYASAPHSRKYVYIDAKTGSVLSADEQICSIDKVGIAHTRYSGIQLITCDSITEDSFMLSESGRGGGIVTIDVNVKNINDSSRIFTDDDNVWNNVNIYQDEVATDVHFGSEKTYDWFFSRFNANSFDGKGTAIYSRVHVDSNYNNAFWNGSFANYGDGDGKNYNPFTSIDICAHELGHGFTQFAAGLKYRNESGALNESFSDIFGKSVEMYATPADFTWRIGEKIKKARPALRDMSNPNFFNHPKYYDGRFWFSGTADNGGVHYNSGVQNYWFYLLTEGGSGKREDFDKNPFKVDSIGIEKAAAIAWLTLSSYLMDQSEYYDVAYLSLEAATALYGENSKEYNQVMNAWYAVGVLENGVGIDEFSFRNDWSLAPNPSGSFITLNNPNINTALSYNIYDITGKVLMNGTDVQGTAIDVSSLAPGVYFVNIPGHTSLKFVKQ